MCVNCEEGYCAKCAEDVGFECACISLPEIKKILPTMPKKKTRKKK